MDALLGLSLSDFCEAERIRYHLFNLAYRQAGPCHPCAKNMPLESLSKIA
jgi:hypothetical protein